MRWYCEMCDGASPPSGTSKMHIRRWQQRWTRTTAGLMGGAKITWIFLKPVECWGVFTSPLVHKSPGLFHGSEWNCCQTSRMIGMNDYNNFLTVCECRVCPLWFVHAIKWCFLFLFFIWSDNWPLLHLGYSSWLFSIAPVSIPCLYTFPPALSALSARVESKRSKPQNFIEFPSPIKVKLDHYRLPLNWQLCAALMWLGQRGAIF